MGLRIETIATGNELLDGSIADTHSARLAAALQPLGMRLQRTTVIPDNPPLIEEHLKAAAARADVVVVIGGLGPTSDDLTLEVAAGAFGSRLVVDDKAKANVERRIKAFVRKLNAGHRKQMKIPEGAKALPNDEGSAPLVHWKVEKTNFFFIPGVPREFLHCLDRHLLPWFKKKASTERNFLYVYKIFAWPESELNEFIKKQEIPSGVDVGFRTHLPENHIKLMVPAKTQTAARRKIAELEKAILKQVGSHYFGGAMDEFQDVMVKKLIKSRTKVAVAESCTGGLLASKITSVSGASKIFDRGFVTYSNEAKMENLGVSEATLKKHGAVSSAVAKQMAAGALKNSRAKRAVAITGIAGPNGGTPKKPVGTIYIALATKDDVECEKLSLKFHRALNQEWSAYRALQLLAYPNSVA